MRRPSTHISSTSSTSPAPERSPGGSPRFLRYGWQAFLLCVALGTGGALYYTSRPAGVTVTPTATIGAPFGVGDSAGNIRLDSAGIAALRWVARRDGTIVRLWVKTKMITHGGAPDSSYFGGTTGVWRVNTYTTTPDGRPDPSHLLASERFVPVQRMTTDSLSQGDPLGEVVGLHLDIIATKGAEYITTFQNIDADPSVNYASLNFLYSARGLQGAQAHNDRVAGAPDALYGLDPRELVGGSVNGAWFLPGNDKGAFAKFLPVYVQQFSDGTAAGQPYYTGASIPAGTPVRQRYTMGAAATITRVGCYLTAADSFTAQLTVNGSPRGSVVIAGGADRFVTATLPQTVAVSPDAVVEIAATPGVTGSLKAFYGGAVFEHLLGLGAAYRWAFEANPVRTVPLYPVF
jgi:hypothetical protein